MNRKLLLMSIGLIFLLTIAIIAASGERRGEAIKVEIIPGSMQLDTDRAACQMYKFDPNTTSISYLTGYGNGDGIITYFDPTDAAANGCGVAAVYPFEISSLTFMLWNQDGAVWPVGIDVVVYDLATPGDPCGGPGALLCSETVSCDLATFGGTFGTVTFSSPCCVSGPFYIGIHYNDAGSSTTFPGFVSDASDIAPAPVLCDLWDMYLGGSWTEWYSAGWGDPPPNYLLYAVDGETESAVCDDDPWAHHKMHWPQLPDEDGWDVHVDMPMFLADDWTCSETGPITDIHWWGSWLDEQEGVINEFIINIWADVPADPLDPMSYSHPGVHLHSINAPAGSFAITPLMPEEPTMFEDWYDPSAPLVIVDDHQEYFRYDLILDEIDFFDQVEGTVYWLSIECLVEDDGLGKQWGWKNTQDHHLDDAVYYDGQDGWVEIYEYADTLKNWFEIQIDPTGAFVNGVGIGAYMDPTEPPIYPNNPWFNYLEDDWWNVWFYDHPLDPERLKDIWIEYTVMPFEQAIPELYAEVTPNWATDLWTLDGMPPGEPRPPLPGDFDYSTTPPVPPEAEWIGRGDPPNIHAGPEPDGRYFLRIPDYNPEWVSVDVRGTNVWVEGTIYHLCRASLDLAFVVTSDFAPDPEGACCYPEPTGSGDILCIVTTLANCEQNLGGSYQGDGTVCGGSIEACCLPDGSCIMADIYCCVNELGGTPQGAGSSCSAPEGCCFPDGSCQDLDPLCCVDLGGTPQGAGTTCTAVEACCMTDGTCQMLDPLCCVDLGGSPQGAQTSCTAVEACCFNDGSCQDLDPLCCIDLGGTPEGAGTACATTTCEVIPEEQKIWKQAPDLSTEGMDVNAMVPLYVLADDFQCTKTEGIQEIHIWGSWFEDIYPGADPPSIEGDPGQVGFHLSLHTDVPAGVLESWSMPGEMVAEWFFEPGEFIYKKVNLEGPHEGWFNPPAEWFPIGDHNCYEYIFKFDETNWFEQQGTAGAPVIYWLDVQAAVVLEGSAFFGWKTSASHWNDDAVWFDGVDGPGQLPWFEMRYPMGHPFETESVDLAFMIGGPCDCQPGEADGITTEINILDIVHLINYKYKGGADPIPYALCSGDANCNCTVDILDIVYVINYKYKGGSYPCTCADFILACPGGLR